MPTVNPPRLQSYLAKLPKELAEPLSQAMSAQDRHAQDLATALNKALVVGDTLQVSQPYTTASPLSVPSTSTSIAGGAPYAFYRLHATQAFTSGATTAVAWDTSLLDTDTAMSGGTFTVPAGKGGLYQVSSTVHLTTGVAAETLAAVYKNGSEYARGSRIQGTATIQGTHVSAVLSLAAGDTLLVTLFQSSGGSRNAEADSSYISITALALQTPQAPSCFPFLVSWPKAYTPTLVLAQAQDVTTPSSPAKLAMALPDWTLTTSSTQSFISIRNMPGLLPGKNYAVQVIAF